ncbi:deoxyribonuclease IV, partial [Candidatus Parcubacteria bacterium]
KHQFGYAEACVHASYLINLASPDAVNLSKSREALIDEIRRAHQLGLDYVIVHSGAHMGEGVERGIQQLVSSLEVVLDATSECEGTGLLLENSAGQGTTLAGDITHLAEVLRLMGPHDRLGFCLDTCHLFAAGYDIGSRGGYEEFCRYTEQLLGLDRIPVLHFNDSKRPAGARVDNHAPLGEGELGETAFTYWTRDERWRHTLAILETPGGDENYRRELKLLKGFRDGQVNE